MKNPTSTILATPTPTPIPISLGLGFALCGLSHAALIGAGAGTMGGLSDANGGRTNIDQNFTNLAPGIYDISGFNYWGVSANGTVTPFLSTQTVAAPNQRYTPLWVGNASTPAVGNNTVTYTPGSKQLIVPNAINVYSGFAMTDNAVGYNGGGLTEHNGAPALNPVVGTQLPVFSNNNLPRTYSSGITVTSSLLTSAAVGPGSGITNATNQDTPGENRLNVDRTFLSLPAGTYSVSDWNLNVFDNTQGGTITPLLLTGTPSSYTSLWLGSSFDPTSNGVQVVSETGSFTLAATTNIYAGFFTQGNGSGIIALDPVNAGSGKSTTDHDNSFAAPTAAGQAIGSFSNPGLNRTYAFGINITQVPEPSMAGLLSLASLALLARRR